VVLTLKEGAIRLNAGIAWAAFEMPKKASPYYRAGMEFSDGDPQALAEFYSRFRKE
jgi:hypothetical protein